MFILFNVVLAARFLCVLVGAASNKKPSSAKRANLERKLNKKMSDFTEQRKPKEKDK